MLALDSLRPFQQQVFADAADDNIEFSPDWFANLAMHALAPGESAHLEVAKVDDAAQSFALLPVKHRAGSRSLSGLSTYYTSLFPPAIAAGDTRRARLALFRQVRARGWSSLWLTPLAAQNATFAETLDTLRAAGWLAFSYPAFGNWYLPVSGRSFSVYFQSLTSRVRHTVLRRSRKFLAGERGRLHIFHDDIDAPGQLATLWTGIYNASWKMPEPHAGFMPGLIALCARRGWLRLGVAYYDEKPVAAQIWIVHHGRAAIYKLAYDERYKTLSAGTLLTAHLLRHALDVDRVAEVDYLIGDDDYKQDWMSHRRERQGIVAYNPQTLRGLLGALREKAGHAVKAIRPPIRRVQK